MRVERPLQRPGRGRRLITRALGRLVGEGEVGEDQALEWAGLVLAGNARRLYGLADWKAERGG
jgi:hypothetical protein